MLHRRVSLTTFTTVALLSLGARAAPHVFSLDTAKDGCTAKVRDVALPGPGGERALFTAKQCPTQVILDPAGKRALALEGTRVKWFAFDGKASELAQLPVSDASVWIEESGKLRAAWLVTDGVAVKQVKDAKDAKDAQRERSVVTFEGKDYPVAQDDAAAFPPWGTPAMALLAELDGKTWKRIEARPTKTEAGDTPGLAALDTPKKPKQGLVSIGDLVAKMTCVGGVLDCGLESAAAQKLVMKDVTEPDAIGALAMTDKKGGAALVFAVMMGDTPHAFPPVHLCVDGADKCTKPVLVEKKGEEQRQLGLATQRGYAIVAEEYSGANAKVVDATGKVVLALPSSSAVVFLPEGTSLK